MSISERSSEARVRKNPPPSQDPTVGLNLGSYGGPKGGGLFLMSEVPLQRFARLSHEDSAHVAAIDVTLEPSVQ